MDMQNLHRNTQHHSNCCNAIFAEKPSGFEVDWESSGTWPIDSEGHTWVKLYCTQPSLAIEFWMRQVDRYKSQLHKIKEALRQIDIGV